MDSTKILHRITFDFTVKVQRTFRYLISDINLDFNSLTPDKITQNFPSLGSWDYSKIDTPTSRLQNGALQSTPTADRICRPFKTLVSDPHGQPGGSLHFRGCLRNRGRLGSNLFLGGVTLLLLCHVFWPLEVLDRFDTDFLSKAILNVFKNEICLYLGVSKKVYIVKT